MPDKNNCKLCGWSPEWHDFNPDHSQVDIYRKKGGFNVSLGNCPDYILNRPAAKPRERPKSK